MHLSPLSRSPGEHQTPIQHSISKTENPKQIHQKMCSFSHPGPKSMAEWTLRGRSLGEGVCPSPSPPHCRLQSPSQEAVTLLHSAGLLCSEASDGQIPGTLPSVGQAGEVIHYEDWSIYLLLGLKRRKRP